MKVVRACPVCKSNYPLYKKYTGQPWCAGSFESADKKFIINYELDICSRCNAVYALKWESIRKEGA